MGRKGEWDGQNRALRPASRGKVKNRQLIKPATAVNQEDKLHFKDGGFCCYSSASLFFPPSAMFRKHIFMPHFKLSSRCSVQHRVFPMISVVTRWENKFLKLLLLVVKGTFLSAYVCVLQESMFKYLHTTFKVKRLKWAFDFFRTEPLWL